MTKTLTHLTTEGAAHMVDIGDKKVSQRVATATASLHTQVDVLTLLERATEKKGDVLATARIAGIMAAKKTSDLIPLCHPLALSKVTVEFDIDPKLAVIEVIATCSLEGKTGVEMEAMTAASVAALTLYDMCKSADPHMVIREIKLLEKKGGKSGHWER